MHWPLLILSAIGVTYLALGLSLVTYGVVTWWTNAYLRLSQRGD